MIITGCVTHLFICLSIVSPNSYQPDVFVVVFFAHRKTEVTMASLFTTPEKITIWTTAVSTPGRVKSMMFYHLHLFLLTCQDNRGKEEEKGFI